MKSMCVHAGVITSLVSTQSVSQVDHKNKPRKKQHAYMELFVVTSNELLKAHRAVIAVVNKVLLSCHT
jgi:hypothetical protein